VHPPWRNANRKTGKTLCFFPKRDGGKSKGVRLPRLWAIGFGADNCLSKEVGWGSGLNDCAQSQVPPSSRAALTGPFQTRPESPLLAEVDSPVGRLGTLTLGICCAPGN